MNRSSNQLVNKENRDNVKYIYTDLLILQTELGIRYENTCFIEKATNQFLQPINLKRLLNWWNCMQRVWSHKDGKT